MLWLLKVKLIGGNFFGMNIVLRRWVDGVCMAYILTRVGINFFCNNTGRLRGLAVAL